MFKFIMPVSYMHKVTGMPIAKYMQLNTFEKGNVDRFVTQYYLSTWFMIIIAIAAFLICTIVPIRRAISYGDRRFVKSQTITAIICGVLAIAFNTIDLQLCQVTTFSAILFGLSLIAYAMLLNNCLDELDKLNKFKNQAN